MLGILGLGSYSTLHFIKRLNAVYNLKYGNYSTCPFKMLNADFNLINPYLPNQFEQLLPIIRKELKQLESLGVSKIAVPNITMHESIDLLGPEFNEIILHPLKMAQKNSILSRKKKVLILGTRYTMESNYVYSFFQNMERISLSDAQLETIDFIRKKVFENGSSKDLMENVLTCIAPLLDNNVLVVIACTELSVLGIKDANWLDLLELQIAEVIRITDSVASSK